jgi:anthranilate synthase component 2
MFLLIDNYDSFTYNLWHYLGELGAEVVVRRNDALGVDEALAMRPQGIVISPGPSDPDRAGICLELVSRAGDVPVLGVCLGHQAIGQAFGGKVVRAPVPMHGKLSRVSHDGTGLFQGFNRGPFQATRYHSLVVERQSLPACLRVNAETEDGIVMGVMHRERPVHGVQFHPESIASEGGHALLANFIKAAERASVAA